MRPTLLIVDDENEARETLKRALHQDFDVIDAPSAQIALDLLQKHPEVAIVVSDEKMPKISGIELLEKIKDQFPKIVRVILSGEIKLEQMVEAVNRAEVHRFILKPWDAKALRLQLQEAYLYHRDLDKMAKLQELAITDPVTGLTNHRFFQERIRDETERAQRHQRVYSLVMVDVDNFKSFNDRFGHPQGDKALAQIAKLLKLATRTTDSVSRYGGEEFAIVLPETPKQAAVEFAERIRRDLENTAVGPSPATPHLITLSLGVSSFPHDGSTAEEIIRRADQALYYAKERGRNRVESYP